MTTFLMYLGLISCAEDSNKDTSEPYVKPVDMSLQILDIMSGAEAGVSCNSDDPNLPSSGTTEADGRVNLRVSGNTQFSITTTDSGYMSHNITGMSGTENFTAVSLMASRDLTDQMYGMLNISVDSSKGILIVALDDLQQRPAIGASAVVNLNHDGAFVFGATSINWSDTVPSGGSGFVAFANIDTGIADVTVTAREGHNCWFAPGGEHGTTATSSVEIKADEVTVALFSCDVEA